MLYLTISRIVTYFICLFDLTTFEKSKFYYYTAYLWYRIVYNYYKSKNNNIYCVISDHDLAIAVPVVLALDHDIAAHAQNVIAPVTKTKIVTVRIKKTLVTRIRKKEKNQSHHPRLWQRKKKQKINKKLLKQTAIQVKGNQKHRLRLTINQKKRLRKKKKDHLQRKETARDLGTKNVTDHVRAAGLARDLEESAHDPVKDLVLEIERDLDRGTERGRGHETGNALVQETVKDPGQGIRSAPGLEIKSDQGHAIESVLVQVVIGLRVVLTEILRRRMSENLVTEPQIYLL